MLPAMTSEAMLEPLGVIAGKGAYPRELVRSARAQGVPRIFAVAFRGETDPVIGRLADQVVWLRIGQLRAMLEALRASGVRQVVMAGQITPTHLFRVKPDAELWRLLKGLQERNAHTIFAAVGEALREAGIELKRASLFMEAAMPAVGVLSSRGPTAREQRDIDLGLRVARTTSGLDIGQTVVIKEGTILAVEAFEGTDATIRRAGRLGGPGSVVVKVAKPGHDMRFDLPVIGEHTLRVLRRVRASALAVQAGRAILLDRESLVRRADELGLCLVAIEAADPASDDGRQT